MSEQTKQSAHCQWSFEDVVTGQELDCDKKPLPGSDYCLFHKPEKTAEEVERFEKAVREQVEKEQDLNFVGFRFPPHWDYFQERTLTAPDFRDTEFEGNVSFDDAQFQPVQEGEVAASFGDARFGGVADFEQARFGGDADFWEARFGGDAHFLDAHFGGVADFNVAHFGEDAEFLGARFGGDAEFSGARFGGDADFRGARFSGDVRFWGAHFARKADFERTVFSGLANWERADLHAQADFTDVAQPAGARFLIGLPRADRKSAHRQTPFAQPATGSQLCRLAKETARRAGDYRLAGEYFYFERMYADLARLPWPFFAWRRLNHLLRRWRVSCRVRRWRFSRRLSRHWVTRRLIRWWLPRVQRDADGKPLLNRQELEEAWLRPELDPKPTGWDKFCGAVRLLFGCAVVGYGERSWRVLGWSVAVVVFWAVLYWWFGLVRLSGRVYPLHSFGQHLYFSVVTFTTLGFGDFEPVKSGLGMFLAASEAFIGMFMIALFVVSVAKRFSRG